MRPRTTVGPAGYGYGYGLATTAEIELLEKVDLGVGAVWSWNIWLADLD